MFSRRWLINYVLIVLIIVFTYVGNRYNVTTGYQSPQPVTGLKAENITRLQVQTADISLTLKREDYGWTLESPIRWPANNINVERLLDIVNSKTDSRLSASEIDLDKFGLKFPRAIITLNDTQLLFGATNNIGERRYAMIGSTVYLLPDVHLPFISQGLTSVVDRRLLPRRFKLNSLRLPGFELRRDASEIWRLTGIDDFNQDQLDQMVENWQGLEATQVRIFNSQDTPRRKIQVQQENGQSHEFFIMSIDPEIVIAHPKIGLQYHFPADLYYQLISLRGDESSS